MGVYDVMSMPQAWYFYLQLFPRACTFNCILSPTRGCMMLCPCPNPGAYSSSCVLSPTRGCMMSCPHPKPGTYSSSCVFSPTDGCILPCICIVCNQIPCPSNLSKLSYRLHKLAKHCGWLVIYPRGGRHKPY